MARNQDGSLDLLLAHLDELCDRAVRGRFTHSTFLSPREARHAELQLRRRGQWHRARLWGGYPDAERVCLLLFPDYAVDMVEESAFHSTPVETLLAIADEQDPVIPLDVCGSGYRHLTHRDFLGSLLSLGLERTVLGDIAMRSDGATVFCAAHIAPFLLSSVERIGGDAVRIKQTTVPPDFDGGRKYQPLRDTVASPRLDCIVAALCNLSRDAAQTAVRSGLVEVDYESEERVDVTVPIPCVISVRGVGKFAVRSLGEANRRGRFPLVADKYV
jgi:RNA-binding protein YlmH